MSKIKPLIIDYPGINTDLDSLSFGYPHLDFSRQCKGAEFREISNRIMHAVASKAMEFVDNPETTVVALAWRSSLPFAECFRELGISNFVHFNVYRDEETLEPICSYVSATPSNIETVIIADPMLATAGTAEYMQHFLNYENTQFIYTSVISAPEGISKLDSLEVQDQQVITARLDSCLDSNAYIVPGIGDFGDKWFYELDLEGYLNSLVDMRIISHHEKGLLIKRAA